MRVRLIQPRQLNIVCRCAFRHILPLVSVSSVYSVVRVTAVFSMNWLWVFLGRGLGSLARYGLSGLVDRRFETMPPECGTARRHRLMDIAGLRGPGAAPQALARSPRAG